MTNKEKYINFCKKEEIPIFNQYWWLDVVCGKDNWDVILIEKGGNILAAMPIHIKSRFNLIYIYQPELTQTMGIYFKYPKKQKYYKQLSFEKEMISLIVEKFPKFAKFSQSFNYKYTNLLPFLWQGFDLKVNYTYTINNITFDDLEKDIHTDIRRRIKRSKEHGIKVFESDDIEKFYELNKMTFKRKALLIPYSLEFIINLHNSCKENNSSKMFFAQDIDGDIVAANYLIYDSKTVYYIMGGVDEKKRNLGGMDVVLLESIKFALESGKEFDFEGSIIESIEKYFRSFGAKQRPYYRVSKINSRLLKLKDMLNGLMK